MPHQSTQIQAINRLDVISHHLQTPTMAQTKDPITCHVLDTTTGRPGANIAVQLSCLSSAAIVFAATTNNDGRISNWECQEGGGSASVQDLFQQLIQSQAASESTAAIPAGSSVWKLEFDTGSYYGVGKTFFPKVDLSFLVKEGEHFHVPLLLGPYSFTTYRGS